MAAMGCAAAAAPTLTTSSPDVLRNSRRDGVPAFRRSRICLGIAVKAVMPLPSKAPNQRCAFSVSSVADARPSHRRGVRGALDRGLHAVIRHAPAQHAGHALADLRISGMRIAIQQRFRGEDLSILTITALRHLLLDPALLNVMEAAACREASELDVLALHCRSPRDARACGRTV